MDFLFLFMSSLPKMTSIPVVLKVGHSIGSYVSLEVFKRLPQQVALLFLSCLFDIFSKLKINSVHNFLELQVKCVIGLYPFLSLNRNSRKQSMIGMIAGYCFH